MRAARAWMLLWAGTTFGCPGSPSVSVEPEAPDWTSAFRYQVKAEGDRLWVDFQVQEGFHVYTQGETVGRPLELEVGEDSPVGLAGDVRYPKGKEKNLTIGRSVTVEGAGRVEAPLANAPPDGATVRGIFRYQVCSDRMCDRPRSAPFEVEVQAVNTGEPPRGPGGLD